METTYPLRYPDALCKIYNSKMLIQSVLVEYEDKSEGKVYANSGCLILNKYVIITSNILISLMTRQNDLKKKLKTLKSGLSEPETVFKSTPQINVVISTENLYICKRGKVIAIYISDYIRKQSGFFLNDWTIDEEDKKQQLKEALSLFFILEISDGLLEVNIDDLIGSLEKICILSRRNAVEVGNKVIIEGTPFGNRNFLGSLSHGIISNIFGTEKCFLLTDAPTAPGCEGSPMYLTSKSKEIVPIGVVLSSLSWWKGEWIGLTLAASFHGIFSSIMREPISTVYSLPNAELDPIYNIANHSLVQVISGSNWGSAILLDKENAVFITNSHVVKNDSPTLLWQDVELKSRVVYKTPENEVYDVAILKADLKVLKETNMRAVVISQKRIQLGETVFAAGFPLFPEQLKPKPTLTKGHISQITRTMIKTSCSVLPGSSGGAILNKNGELLGIVVCNAKIADDLSAVPRLNMAIPITNIIDIIRNYIKTGDVTILHKLKVENLQIKKEWNFLNSNL